MTVQTETRQVVLNGNDSATTFPFSFKVISSADLRVTLTSGTTDTVLVLDTDYSVTLNGDQETSPGGEIEYPLSGDPLATGDTLQIDTNMSALQEDDLQNGGGFSPTVLENRLDALTIMLQQIKRDVARAPRLPNTFPANSALSRALSVPGRFVGVDANGNWTTLTGTGSATDASNVTLAAEHTGEVDMTVAEFLNSVSVNVKRFGAVGDGVTDDSAAIQAAEYYVYKNFSGGNVVFPPGDYLIQNTIFKRSRVNWIGETSVGYFAASLGAVRIKRHTSLATMIYHAGSLYEIRNIEFEGNGGDVSGTATKIFALPPAGTPLPADDPLRPGVTTYQKGSGLWLYQCTLSNCWYAIHDNTNFGAVNMRQCTLRQFTTAVVNTSDSRYIDNIFVGSSFAGMSQNVGGIHITGNLFEFNRSGADEAAYGIFLQNNSAEIQIDNNRFDRNAGQDIYITSGTKRPHTITINGNHFMRAAWGSDVTVRSSLYLSNADNVVINGNVFYAASSYPSTIQGLISPRAAVAHSGCVGLIITNNGYNRLAREISLKDISLKPGIFQMWPNWVQSSSGTGEWYLTSNHDADTNPWIGEPAYVTNDGVLLTPRRVLVGNNAAASNSGLTLTVTVPDGHGLTTGSLVSISGANGIDVDDAVYTVGTVTDAGGGMDYINIAHAADVGTGTVDIYTAGVGDLNVGEWDWGDNDSLGFSTVYARVSGDTDPGFGNIVAHYDVDPVMSYNTNASFPTRSTDYQDDEWVDVYMNRTHAGRVLVANDAVASIVSNQIRITVADGHGVEAGDWVYVTDDTTIAVNDGAYQVASVADAGGGNDYIYIDYTAGDAGPGTIDIYTVTAEEFTLRTRRRVHIATGANEFGSLSQKLTATAHGITPAYRMFSEWPFTVVRANSTALPAVLNGTIIDHNSNLSHDWYATSSDDNMSIHITSDILGDKLTVRVINTTADDIAYQIGIRR